MNLSSAIYAVPLTDWSALKIQYRRYLSLLDPDSASAASPSDDRREKRFIFRGQANADWHLRPSLTRHFGEITNDRGSPDSDPLLAVQHMLLNAFDREMMRTGEYRGLHLSDCDAERQRQLLSIGQHHGLPTSLLDWTESIYIAAYFAFEYYVLESPIRDLARTHASPHRVAVWAADRGDSEFWNANHIYFPESAEPENKRLIEQSGLFSELRIESIDQRVAAKRHNDGNTSKKILKFTIPASFAQEGLDDLRMMGITPNRLYGGRDGAARAAYLEVKLQVAAKLRNET